MDIVYIYKSAYFLQSFQIQQMPGEVKVAIAEDHGLMRAGLISMLDGDEVIKVVGGVVSGEEAINMANRLSPDVFLIDIVMKGMSGIEATRWIKENNPKIRVILISGEVTKEYITNGIKSGIDGYLHKDADKETLKAAIHSVMNGVQYFSPQVLSLVFNEFYLKGQSGKGLPAKRTTELTKREEEVLTLIASGKSLKEVAEKLFISIKTVESHKFNIQVKLGLTNTAQLVLFAIEHDLVELKKKS